MTEQPLNEEEVLTDSAVDAAAGVEPVLEDDTMPDTEPVIAEEE